ncbi:MAG: hypothetical protein H6765_03025 [Candidatus Peribacteria bacterium]|nr:MAG: hypothetical protein H6765_03025 [Candidatus Peribacteria bacterium]
MEKTYDALSSPMYTMIYNDELLRALESVCDEKAISRASTYAQAISAAFNEQKMRLNDAEELDLTFQWYNTLVARQNQALIYDDATFCSLKYVLYYLQDYLREWHMDVLDRNGLFKDFDAFSSSLYGPELKQDLMEMLLKRTKQYPDLLGKDLDIRIVNEGFAEKLSENKQELLTSITALMTNTVYKVLYDLIQAKVMTTDDADLLMGKIKMEYVDSCDVFHGKYEIKETLDGNGTHIDYETQSLSLKLNFCTNYFVLRDLDKIFEKIVAHELAHHFYYYHDDQSDEFLAICWKES